MSSRKEIDIERYLTPISTSMSLSNPYVDEDIQIYIQNQLQDHHKLRTWPKPLSNEIGAALVNGAQGMYVTKQQSPSIVLIDLLTEIF